MTTAVAYVGNTNSILLSGLKDELANTWINDATVTFTIKDATGTPLEGVSWPLSMSYIAASNGNYAGYLTHSMGLLNGKKYTALIDADGSTSDTELFGHWELSFTAKNRT